MWDWEFAQDVLNVILCSLWLLRSRMTLQINYHVPISISVQVTKLRQAGWAHYKVRWNHRAVKQCDWRESKHILPLCVSRSLCSTNTDRARRAKLESARPGSGETLGREKGSVLVYVEEREREKENERESEVGKRLPPLSISRASCGSHFVRASGRCGISVRPSKWIIKQRRMWQRDANKN